MTEQLAFEKVRRNRGAVDGNKRMIASLTVNVQGSRDQFLSRTRFAEDEHGGVAVGGKSDRLVHTPHTLTRSDQRVDPALLCSASLVRAGRQAIEQRTQFVPPDRLRQMIEGAEPHGFDGILCARKRRQHHDRRRILTRSNAAQNVEAVEAARHPQIKQHGVDFGGKCC
jgi:hypothetical protein